MTKVLNIVETPYRATVEEQDDTILWLTSTLRASDDHLVGSITMASGRRYAFRDFNNGDWFNDEAADAYEPNEFGGHDCVVGLTA